MTSAGRMRLIVGFGGVVLALVGAATLWMLGGKGPGRASLLATVECPFESPTDTPIRCGTLTTPQFHTESGTLSRARPGVSVFFAVLSAKTRTPEADPVLVLDGESGQSGTARMLAAWPAYDALNRTRDLVFVDLRGAGHSVPAFTCPNVDAVKARLGGLNASDAEACVAPMRKAGYDLSAFSTAESAGDLAALRRALGLRSWNLVASGYGAVVALDLLRRDGEGVRALLLDSPQAPKTSAIDLDGLAATQFVFRRVFADCKAQAACDRAFPKLADVFDDLTHHLFAQPLPAVFVHPTTGAKTAAALGTADLLTLLTRIIGSGDEAARVPALIWSLSELVHERPPAITDPVAALYAAYWRVTPSVSHGLAAVITCREIQPWANIEGSRAMAVMFRPFVDPQALALEYQTFCPVWKLSRPRDDLDAPPLASVPTLALTGEYDTLTPSYQANALTGAMPKAQTFAFRGFGHGLLAANACSREIAARFLDAPGRKPENGCALGASPTFVTAPAPVASAPAPVASAVPAPTVALAMAAPLPPPVAKPALPSVTTVPCPFPIPGARRVDCGTLSVPEHHDRIGGKTLSLFFAITRAGDAKPLGDPLLVLNGGPGQPGTDLIKSGWERLAEVREHRDIIYVDQRGTGYSQPGLYCRTLSPVAFWHGGLTAADAEECARPIRAAGYDLAAFDTLESAYDLAALRVALGIKRWNLFGTSYGTALAMELVRRDEGGVRGVVLNSPTTNHASWLDLRRMAAIRDAYRHLFADCAADAVCATTYPDLEKVFLDLAWRLTESPLPVTYQDPGTGVTVRTKMNFAALLDILTIVVGSGTTGERVPALLWHLEQVMLGREPARPELLSWLYMPYWKTMDMIAYGLNAAIGCREIRPWIDPVALRHEGDAYQPYVMPQSMEQDYDVFCPAWKLPVAAADLRKPVISDRPTLLLTGDYDTLTPTTMADTIAQTLSAAQVLRFHAIGHDVFSSSVCARAALTHFIDDPKAQITLPCLQTPRAPQFIARRG